MASGNYARKTSPQAPIEMTTKTLVPARATRELPQTGAIERTTETKFAQRDITINRAPKTVQTARPTITPAPPTPRLRPRRLITDSMNEPLRRNRFWLQPWLLCVICVSVSLLILISAAMAQRPGDVSLLNFGGGQSYDIEVGTWAQATPGPLPSATAAPRSTAANGTYSVIGKPTLTVAFINQVLATYHSPAAGLGQDLYNLGVQYDIDPAFALAFFMHESSFGTQGVARYSLSLGNLRCYTGVPKCVNNYAYYPTWQAGFQAWYALIRNVYVSEWHLTTIEQIIPTYAPNADNNDEAEYIASLKNEISTWHSGTVIVQ